MKTREQNRNKRTEIERFDWFIERIQTREINRYFRFDGKLQHDWPIEQCHLHIRVFFGWKTKRPCFDLFIHRLTKQIANTLIRKVGKPFFKVTGKSLLKSGKRNESLTLCKGIPDSVGFWIPHQVVDSGFFVNGTCIIRIPIASGIRIIARAVFRIQSPRFLIPQGESLNSSYPRVKSRHFIALMTPRFCLSHIHHYAFREY